MCIRDSYEIVAVVTQPDRAVGRKKVIQETPVKQAAKEAGLPIYQPEKLSGSSEMEAIMNLGADGIVTEMCIRDRFHLIQVIRHFNSI